jgi:hypothetical protein
MNAKDLNTELSFLGKLVVGLNKTKVVMHK